MGQYIQQDPIGLAGNNPTLYTYVRDTNIWIDPFGLYSLFRAVFAAEFNDIVSTGVLRNIPGGYETGKLFATTHSDATRFGDLLSRWETTNFRVVEVNVPDGIKVTRFQADGMSAVSVDSNDLKKLEVVGCGL